MDFEKELQQVAALYERKGYEVILRPRPDDLPSFAKDFKVEILGKRRENGVLVSVKKNHEEMSADPNLSRYADVTSSQQGWRFDFFILEKGRNGLSAKELTEMDLIQNLNLIAGIVKQGNAELHIPFFASLWGLLEAAMRMRVRAIGGTAGWGTSPQDLLNELYSEGVFSEDEFARLEEAKLVRNQIVHGFAVEKVSEEILTFLVEIARRLVEESKDPQPVS